MEGTLTALMVMLKTEDPKHKDIPAYEKLFKQVKMISRSGDTERRDLAFIRGVVAKSVGAAVTHKRELRAAVKVEKLELTPEQVAKMEEAARFIGGMTSGPNGTLSVAHGSTALAEISAGVENPQAFCLPQSSVVSIIPSDGRTVEHIARSLEEQRLLVPDPHGQPITLDQLKVVVAALFGLNIDPKTSMLLCLVSTAGQLAEDGHNEAALILLGW